MGYKEESAMPPRLQQRRPPNQYPFFQQPPIRRNRMARGIQGGFYQHGHAPQGMNRQLPRRGGFLSRLLGGRQNQAIRSMQQPINPFQFGSGIGIQEQTGIKSFLSADSISKFLGQTQQVLRTGQQIGSMVQQYGPLVRNLPALWKIYRGFQNNDSEESEESNESVDGEGKKDGEQTEEQQVDKKHVDIDDTTSDDHQLLNDDKEEINHSTNESLTIKSKTTGKKKNNKKESKPKESIPKLYI